MKTTVGLLSIIILFFTGCLLDDEDTATTTAASQTAVAAAAPTSVGNSGLPGKTISFNPTLVFNLDGVTLDYSNSSTDGSYPTGDFANLTISEQVEGDRLVISITVNNEKIDLGFSFTDRGGEGFIDEAVLDLVEVNDEVKELPAKVTVAIDAGTVRNENVKTEDLPDFSGAPTSEEWNKYIVGTAMLITNDANTTWSGTVESTLVYFTSSSAGVYYDMDDGETGNFSYNYTPPSSETSNVGEVSVVSEWIQNDADYPDSLGNAMRDEFSMKLTFTDFYNGKREDNPGGKSIDTVTGKEYPETKPETGTFNAVTNVSLYLETSKKSTSAAN